jgi:CRISPR system Cascade subunit CasD
VTRWLVLRFDAPMMSFGGIAVDERNPTMRFPGRSMVAGLLANAVGYDHREVPRIQALQDRLRHAVRVDVEGEVHLDYQTVDLGDVGMRDGGWTTWGRVEDRAGGAAARLGTHIRYRDYVTNAVYTVLVTLDRATEAPTLDEVRAAVERPARPLFLGRKACLPSAPLVDPVVFVDGSDPVVALRAVPRARRPGRRPEPERWTGWVDGDGSEPDRSVRIADLRDWANQVHTGRRWVREVSEPWEVRHG